MTDTTHKAPARLWADGNQDWVLGSWSLDKEFKDDVEYVRADLVQAAVAAERERCAKVAESRWRSWGQNDPHGAVECDATACENIAAAIREGGE